MRQVFSNLISNGIKYRSERPVEITIDSKKESERDWILCVKDNGIGFDVSHADQIFKLFQRLEPRSETAGTGIGLTLTKKVIEAHRGRIWADSKPGVGSSFFFTVPQQNNEGISSHS